MYGNIFDSHAHYDDERFDADRHELLSSLPGMGVSAVMTVASSLESSLACAKLAVKYDYIWFSAGIHPHEATGAGEDMEERLGEYALNKRCMAIGEIGLDYHYDFSPREKQLEIFERQLALATRLGLPVIIHDREAHADTVAIIKKYRPRGVIHCYTGSAETALELIRLGLYIGFTGAVTFKNARRAPEAVAAIPLDRLLLETDCPYMAPAPFRGRRCDSAMIPHIAGVIAGIKSADTQAVIDQANKNACDLFGIEYNSITQKYIVEG